MSKKVLNIAGIKNELEGASLYFTGSPAPHSPQEVEDQEPVQSIPELANKPLEPAEPNIAQAEKSARKKPKTIANGHAIVHASINAGMLANHHDDLIETIRKTVKQVGKDTVFMRLTPDEKADLAAIVYAFNELYRGNNRKVSENAVGRIALNLLLQDHRTSGELSILTRVLAALNA